MAWNWLARLVVMRLPAHFDRDAGLERLFSAVFHQALKDLKPFLSDGQVKRDAWKSAEPWQRGRALSAAVFLADAVPSSYAHALRKVIADMLAGVAPDEAEEFVLADRWVPPLTERKARPVKCFRCGEMHGVWRQVFSPPVNLPDAYRWRYGILENHVPLCYTCYRAATETDDLVEWGKVVWGMRFDAWERLHRRFEDGDRPQWDKEQSPLWPPEFGGALWETGKGVMALNRYPSWVKRRKEHVLLARTLLRRRGIRGDRREVSPLWRVAQSSGKGRHRRGRGRA